MSVLALDLLKKPELLSSHPIYVIEGEEIFLRTESITVIENSVFPRDEDKIGLTRKSGESVVLADVLDELCTPSFFSPKRMVVIDPADEFISKNRAELEKYAEHPSSDSVLVLAVKSFPSSTRLAKILVKQQPGGLIINARPPKPEELIQWVMVRAIQNDSKIDKDAAILLTELIGAETGILDQEIAKLAVACHDGKKSVIHRDDVARYVHAGRTESVWQMLDLATTGNMAKALEDLDSLLSSGEPPVKLIAAMAFSLRKLHHAGILRSQKMGPELAFKEAGMMTFPKAIQAAKSQHAHLGPKRVKDLPNMLTQADLDLKGWSELSPRTVMERLIVKLALPRKD